MKSVGSIVSKSVTATANDYVSIDGKIESLGSFANDGDAIAPTIPDDTDIPDETDTPDDAKLEEDKAKPLKKQLRLSVTGEKKASPPTSKAPSSSSTAMRKGAKAKAAAASTSFSTTMRQETSEGSCSMDDNETGNQAKAAVKKRLASQHSSDSL